MIKNEYLKNIVNDLTRKINHLKDQKNESEIEKQRIKFLGRFLAGKTKARAVIANEKLGKTKESTKHRDLSNNNHSSVSLWTNITDITRK